MINFHTFARNANLIRFIMRTTNNHKLAKCVLSISLEPRIFKYATLRFDKFQTTNKN